MTEKKQSTEAAVREIRRRLRPIARVVEPAVAAH
jgi:hypothetical protein